MLVPDLGVRAVTTGLTTPTSLAFIGPNDFLVLEKNTGKVQRVVNGAVVATVLDLAVNFASERGVLGIALHPNFPTNRGVYLYWTESTTGADTNVLSETPLLGNRVDRFVLSADNNTLTPDANVIRVRAEQPIGPGEVREFGNHDGGVIDFGADGKLYMFVGDVGRRGQMQNLANGPFEPPAGDDAFGGPEPDDAHLTGVVLRLNADGTAPSDNPFFAAGGAIGGEIGDNLKTVFSYGHRNSFGFDFDPVTGALWLQENGDDSFSELNVVHSGMNGGWIQVTGPISRVGEFREIETTFGSLPGLQQLRYPPTRIAESSAEARARLFMLPGAQYSDPAFSWKWEVAPGGIGFVRGRGLGVSYQNDLLMGFATPNIEGGALFRFNLTGNRRKVAVDDPRLEDRVADNLAKHDITESESLLIGREFGVVTDIETGPNGNLFVVSISNGEVYEIFRN